jgi:hypothetical protein
MYCCQTYILKKNITLFFLLDFILNVEINNIIIILVIKSGLA